MALIECRKLTRKYTKGDTTITPLDELDLEIEEGSFTALMGPSGSGKTTLLNLIAGVDSPTSGELVIDGSNVAKYSRSKLAQWRSEYIGYIFQLYNLIPVLTAYENVELPLLLHKMSSKERHSKVAAALELVQGRDHQAAAGVAHRVAQGDGTTVDVELGRVGIQFLEPGQGKRVFVTALDVVPAFRVFVRGAVGPLVRRAAAEPLRL